MAEPRRPIPPTRIVETPKDIEPAPPPPMPVPVPVPAKGKADAKKTKMLFEEASAPIAGWLVPLTGKHKGTDFRVREGKTSVGSDPGCDIILEDEFISGQHANIKFVLKDGERIFILTDLDSSNGTFLNDAEERIAREELVDNDTVTFGQTKCKFKCL